MEIYKKLVDKYGKESQILKTVEECSELIKALCNNLYNRQHNVEEEMLDVEIMLKQVKVIYGLDDTEHGFKIECGVGREEFIKDFIRRSSVFMSNLIVGFNSEMDALFYTLQMQYDIQVLKTLFDEKMLNDWYHIKQKNLKMILNRR